jgi:hypothetical protein
MYRRDRKAGRGDCRASNVRSQRLHAVAGTGDGLTDAAIGRVTRPMMPVAPCLQQVASSVNGACAGTRVGQSTSQHVVNAERIQVYAEDSNA